MSAERDTGARNEADEIKAAHPLRTGRHDLYAEAMRLVGERHAKSDLVDLVNWLLYRSETEAAHWEKNYWLTLQIQEKHWPDCERRIEIITRVREIACRLRTAAPGELVDDLCEALGLDAEGVPHGGE